MEKITFRNSRGLTLAGVSYPAESEYAVIIAHGFCANKDRDRLVNLAERLSSLECGVLCFDQVTSGESEEGMITVGNLLDDLQCAKNYMKSKGYTRFGFVGESLGGLISLQAYAEDLNTMVLWAPVTSGKKNDIDPKRYLDKGGYFSLQKDGKEFRISKEYVTERKHVNQEQLLSKVQGPVLILHGTEDFVVPQEDSRNAMKYLPTGSRLEFIEGGDHQLNSVAEKVIQITVDWFKKYVKPSE